MAPESTAADEIARLYGLEPGDFVAERNALAKAWRKAGRKDDAAVIAALRKPSAPESAVNRAARRDPASVAAWRDALERARAAQGAAIGGAGAADLRAALAALRSATGALAVVAAQTAGADGRRLDLAGFLQSLSPAAADQAVAGVLGSADPGDADPFAGAPEPAVRERRAPPQPPAGPRRRDTFDAPEPEPEPAPAPEPAAAERRRALGAERARLAALVDACRAGLADAEAARRAAEAARRAAEADVERANGALSDARARLAEADAALGAAG